MEIYVTDDKVSTDDIIHAILTEKDANNSDASFYVVYVEKLVEKVAEWKELLPRVDPFYVKCNSSPAILRPLVALGCGLDVATKSEIQRALALNVPTNRLVYSNTCKAPSNLIFAREAGVHLTVFDSECELIKIKNHFPDAKLLIRIKQDDNTSAIPMGRFGADYDDAQDLLEKCWELGLDVVGVSFHVGCGSCNPNSYAKAIGEAKIIFGYAESKGRPLQILNIGGGFPGSIGNIKLPFSRFAEAINNALDRHFPVDSGVGIIAEPGQHFAAQAQSVFTSVIGVQGDLKRRGYIMSDGVHGSFRDTKDFKLKPEIRIPPFYKKGKDAGQPCSLWGPTLDPTDRIVDNCMLPVLEVGQWLEFKRMGAYTNELFTNFNGIEKPKTVVITPRKCLYLLQE